MAGVALLGLATPAAVVTASPLAALGFGAGGGCHGGGPERGGGARGGEMRLVVVALLLHCLDFLRSDWREREREKGV